MPQSRMRVPWISIVSPSITLAWPVRSAANPELVVASNTAIGAMNLRAQINALEEGGGLNRTAPPRSPASHSR